MVELGDLVDGVLIVVFCVCDGVRDELVWLVVCYEHRMFC